MCTCTFCRNYEKYKWAELMECKCGCHDADGMTGHDRLCCSIPNGLRKNNPHTDLKPLAFYKEEIRKWEEECEREEKIYFAIKPETDLENRIIADKEFIEGAMWGKPRNGHPEGEVIYHIKHVLKNVDKYSTPENRETLRLIAIIHDTLKYKVDPDKPKGGENHHAMFARRFAEKFIKDEKILDLIELHDEAYNSWRKRNETRAKNLIKRLGDSIDLYMTFYQCDNETGDKENEDFLWFKNLVKNES